MLKVGKLYSVPGSLGFYFNLPDFTYPSRAYDLILDAKTPFLVVETVDDIRELGGSDCDYKTFDFYKILTGSGVGWVGLHKTVTPYEL